jgi:hypothetical protein
MGSDCRTGRPRRMLRRWGVLECDRFQSWGKRTDPLSTGTDFSPLIRLSFLACGGFASGGPIPDPWRDSRWFDCHRWAAHRTAVSPFACRIPDRSAVPSMPWRAHAGGEGRRGRHVARKKSASASAWPRWAPGNDVVRVGTARHGEPRPSPAVDLDPGAPQWAVTIRRRVRWAHGRRCRTLIIAPRSRGTNIAMVRPPEIIAIWLSRSDPRWPPEREAPRFGIRCLRRGCIHLEPIPMMLPARRPLAFSPWFSCTRPIRAQPMPFMRLSLPLAECEHPSPRSCFREPLMKGKGA